MFESLPIKLWNEDDRPREKMALKGRQNLSDAELLAILIGHGTPNHSALDLGKIILSRYGGDLNSLARASLQDLCAVPGIGNAKAISIMAAMELAARKKHYVSKVTRITGSREAYDHLRGHMVDLNIEVFWVLYLNQNNRIMGSEKISEGGIAGTVIDVRILMRKVLERLACGIIIAHNHPSGNIIPSDPDVKITKQIEHACKLLDVALLDHIIIGASGYYSFRDENRL
ncbi:MAG: DNA repair protein RadC [Bacteroidetes bacterium]|nr:DNA repair protein RadC [Bacteroidota bacterium]